jgi:glycosyltransferase involved in cell wall biosynthesis
MDVACYVSRDEVKELLKIKPELNVRSIPLSFYDISQKQSIEYTASYRKNIMFVAGFKHSPNIDGVIWFCKKVLPAILNVHPDIKFYVVGSDPVDSVKALASDNVIVTGYVSEDRLNELYAQTRLVVVPLLSGAGVKGKVIESIFNKVPVITTSIGCEGIDNSEGLITVRDSAEDFSKAVIDMYEDYETLNRISNGSLNYIDNNFSFNAVRETLSEFIPELKDI